MTPDELALTLASLEEQRIALRAQLLDLVAQGDAAVLAFVRSIGGPDAEVEVGPYADTFTVRRPGRDVVHFRATIYADGGQVWALPETHFGPGAQAVLAVDFLRSVIR